MYIKPVKVQSITFRKYLGQPFQKLWQWSEVHSQYMYMYIKVNIPYPLYKPPWNDMWSPIGGNMVECLAYEQRVIGYNLAGKVCQGAELVDKN